MQDFVFFSRPQAVQEIPPIIEITKPQIIKPKDDIIEVEAEEIPNSGTSYFENDNLFSWEIVERPIFDERGREIKHYKRIERSDNRTILNICPETYNPTRNVLFTEMLHNISRYTGFEIGVHKELKDGRIVLAMLNAPELTDAHGHRYKNNMIVGNSHNGQTAFFIGSTATMIRCENQLTTRMQSLRVYHRSDMHNRLKDIERLFIKLQQNGVNIMSFINQFAKIKVNQDIKRKFINYLLGVDMQQIDSYVTRKQNTIRCLEMSINREMADIGQTAHGLLQGVTYWTTHERETKEPVYSNIFGSNNNYQQKAMEYLNELESVETVHYINN
jgi:hypothetical protein